MDKDHDKTQVPEKTIKDLVNTPFKKAMFGVQILSYILIVGSPLIGGALGNVFNLNTARTAGVILGVLIAGEVLFYGSLAFLGKEVVKLLRYKLKTLVIKKPKFLQKK